MNLDEEVREFIRLKNQYKLYWGKPNRNKLKKQYQRYEAQLWHGLPDEYRVDGLVLKKGIVKSAKQDYPYIAIYTEKSLERMEAHGNPEFREQENHLKGIMRS